MSNSSVKNLDMNGYEAIHNNLNLLCYIFNKACLRNKVEPEANYGFKYSKMIRNFFFQIYVPGLGTRHPLNTSKQWSKGLEKPSLAIRTYKDGFIFKNPR